MGKMNIESITKMSVNGFKSIAEERTIEICPLTILAGANSSGKSSIMQPLLMLKQTLEAISDPGPLKIDGPNVKFTLVDQFLSTLIDEQKVDHFQIQIATGTPDFSHSVWITFVKKELGGIKINEMTIETKLEVEEQLSFQRFTLYPDMSPKEIKSLVDQNPLLGILDVDTVKRSRCFLGFESSQDGYRSFDHTANLESNIVSIIHLPGLRGNPERIHSLIPTGSRYTGPFQNYAASLIYEWQEAQDERLKTVTNTLYTLGLTGKVGTKKIGDAHVELQVGRLPHGSIRETDMVNIADVGIGVSQVLPVLVALIAAEPGQLVYLEQPEMHLHPRAQVALAHVLVDAANRGVRVVAETHSSLLLLAIQTHVAEGDISEDLVKLHWFKRREDGVTDVISGEVDDVGAYGEWPEDFDDVDLGAQSRYLDAIDRLRFGNEGA